MGVRREGTGKKRTAASINTTYVRRESPPVTDSPSMAGAGAVVGAGANGGGAGGGDASDDENDPELQELYVQAYACQIFADDAAAQAVEDDGHLRPLFLPQEPEGQPLMLDRFDARWMLDVADFTKGSLNFTGAANAVNSEDEEADVMRYAGLPPGDHSLEVEGLGRFAPQGSYAHDARRGLGDQHGEDGPTEVYGYYGRTASPPPTTARGMWAAIPAPQEAMEEKAGGVVGEVGGGVDGGDGEVAKTGGDDKTFVPDFGVPEGIVIPSTSRQHVMMVGTARTAVRSPQLEVLLRLRQASNVAFSFLSDGDLLHSYYLFLKSWGESALASEYVRQQRLQAERADEKDKQTIEEDKAKLAEERATLVKASAVSPAAHAGKGKEESDEDTADAPNLLGGAYDSSDDEGGDLRTGLVGTADVTAIIKGSNTPVKTQSSAKVTCASKITDGDGSVEWPPSRRGETLKELAEPDKAKRQVIEKMVGFVVKYGQAFEDKARPRAKSDSNFDFLLPSNRLHAYYKALLAEMQTGGTSADRMIALERENGTEPSKSTEKISGAGMGSATNGETNMQATSKSGERPGRHGAARSEAMEKKQAWSREANYAGRRKDPAAVSPLRGNADEAGGKRKNASVPASGHDAALVAKEGNSRRVPRAVAPPSADAGAGTGQKGPSGRIGANKMTLTSEASYLRAKIAGDQGASAETSVSNHNSSKQTTPSGLQETSESKDECTSAEAMALVAGVGPDDEGEDGGGEESPETRRANRLKRARLMKGHYKLAVLRSSGGHDKTADSSQFGITEEGPAVTLAPDEDGESHQASGDHDLSEHDLSDLDSEIEGSGDEHVKEDKGTRSDEVRALKAEISHASCVKRRAGHGPTSREGKPMMASFATGNSRRKKSGGNDRKGSRSRSRSQSKEAERRDRRKEERSLRHRRARSNERRSRSRSGSRGRGRGQGDKDRSQRRSREKQTSPGRTRNVNDENGRHRSGGPRRASESSRDEVRDKIRNRSSGEESRTRSGAQKNDNDNRRDSREHEDSKRESPLVEKRGSRSFRHGRSSIDDDDKRRDRSGRGKNTSGSSTSKESRVDEKESSERSPRESHSDRKEPRKSSSARRRSRSRSPSRSRSYREESRERGSTKRSRRR